jgi:GT2 family glycosyltransferase
MTPMVLIGTPAYGSMVHTDHVRSLFDFINAGIGFRYFSIGNESLITRARNSIVAAFNARPEFTHLLFLDADVYLSADSLKTMIDAQVPVIGAPVALKGFDADGNRIWNVGTCLGTAGPLFKVDHIGTAVLLLTRQAIDALIANAVAQGRIYERNTLVRGDFDADLHYDVFQVGVKNGLYLSEDFYACRQLRDLGYDIHVNPSIITTHHGIMAV